MNHSDGHAGVPQADARTARPNETLNALLAVASRGGPARPALIAPGRAPLDFLGLRAMAHFVAVALRGIGIGREERVAIALPDGPELAVATLGTASACVALPLVASSDPARIERHLAITAPTALIAMQDEPTPAREIALRLGVQIIDIVPCHDAPAGTFVFRRIKPAHDLHAEPSRATDTAVLLPDAPPGLSALSHAELLATAEYVAASLELTERDRALCMSSIAAGHGLLGVLLPSIAAGASTICPPDFDSRAFAGWLSTLGPSWYAGPPSLHARIVIEPGSDRVQHSLRFIRSYGEALSDICAGALEEIFGVPVKDARRARAATH